MKRLLIGTLLLAGCSSPQASIEELSTYLRSSASAQQHIERAVNPTMSLGRECGGAIVRDPHLRLVTIPNKFTDLSRYVNEFKQNDFRHKSAFFQMLSSARPVHVVNNSYCIVNQIDIIMPWQNVDKWTPDAYAVIETAVHQHILPHTYRPAYRPDNVVMWWHTHPSGTGPSDFDYENASKPFAVARRRNGMIEVTVVDGDKEEVLRMPYAAATLARR